MVGHLGVTPLAGLGIASAILQTIIGLMVFLAYSTTPAVARRLGAGDERGAVAAGVDGSWLALGIGVVLAVCGWFAAPLLVAAFGAPPEVAAQATTYLTISMLGLPAMLLVFAATGLLRGLQDTRTPLIVAVAGFGANVVLNFTFIYGLGLGIAGSALGTVVAQWAMVLVYLVVVARHARRVGAPLLPHHAGIRSSALSGGWLFVRTASLRAAMLLAVFTATRLGPDELAAFQVTMTVFATVAFALDALAIAAQALVGKGLGGGDAGGRARGAGALHPVGCARRGGARGAGRRDRSVRRRAVHERPVGRRTASDRTGDHRRRRAARRVRLRARRRSHRSGRCALPGAGPAS